MPSGYLDKYDAAPNDQSSGARTANRAAIVTALSENNEVGAAGETFYLPAHAAIPFNGGKTLAGVSRFEGSTAFVGDGHMFEFAVGGERRYMHDFSLRNENAGSVGDLIRLLNGSSHNTSIFMERMTFGLARQHIYIQGGAVGWALRDIEFTAATVRSRYLGAAYRYREDNCYTKANFAGLRIGNEQGLDVNGISLSGIMEAQQQWAVALIAEGHNIFNVQIDCHFEGNGRASGAPDLVFQTATNHQIKDIDLSNSTMVAPWSTQDVRISITEHTAGNIDRIRLGHGFNNFGKPLTIPATSKIKSHAWA